METFLVLRERTLPWLLLRLLQGKRPILLAVVADLPFLTPVLQSLADRLVRRGLLRPLEDARPELLPARGINALIDLRRLEDPFLPNEDRLSAFFRFDEADGRLGNFGLAYRHACCSSLVDHYMLLYTVARIEDQKAGPVIGLDRYRAGLLKILTGRVPATTAALHMVSNSVMALLVAAWSIIFTLRRTRLSPPPPRHVRLGLDFVDDSRDAILWGEVAQSPDDMVAVCRSAGFYSRCGEAYPDRHRVMSTDGIMGPGDALASLAEVLPAIGRMWLFALRFCGSDFRAVITLPYRCLVWRALFNRYSFKFFWARDEYNAEHVIRTMELRRRGSRSMGIMHGIPTIYPVQEQLRYLDLDVFYVFGVDQYRRYYAARWPETMTVRPVGSFGLTRQQLEELGERRGRDIVCYLEPSFFEDKVLDAVRRMAEAFPDRKVYISVKLPRLKGSYGEKIARLESGNPPNIVPYRDTRSYLLMFECAYVVVDGSTLGMEAVQFGRAAFHLDLDDRWKSLYYRDFPAMCVTSADELILKIKEIENGKLYPREQMADAIDMSGRIIWDRIREDMGLPAKTEVPLPHLSCASAAPE